MCPILSHNNIHQNKDPKVQLTCGAPGGVYQLCSKYVVIGWFVDFTQSIPAHTDALEKVNVLHHDIGLFNLLLAIWSKSEEHLEFLNALPKCT